MSTLLTALCFGGPVVAYVAFCFIAEHPNPFARPRAPMRRVRWHFGRRVAAALLLGAACAAGLAGTMGLTPMGAGLVVAVVALPLALWAWLSYRRRSVAWEFDEPPT